MDTAIFLIITWIPVISLLGAIVFACLGWYKKFKNQPSKKFFVLRLIFLSIFIAYFVLFFIIGAIGFGPGPYDSI